MIDTLEVLNESGHLTLTWDVNDPDQVARAREDVARLKAAGYSFFAVVQGTDEVEAGDGELVVERIVDPVRGDAPTPLGPPTHRVTGGSSGEDTAPKRRGRPPKTPTTPEPDGRRVVAMRPQAGG